MSALFRREVLEARRNAGFGAALPPPPLASTAWCVVAVALATAMIALLLFGEYTKRTRVPGITVPSGGVLKLVAPQAGIVIERHVEEGQQVVAGQVLFVVLSERFPEAGAGSGAQSAILEQLDRRRASLVAELDRREALQRQQEDALSRRLAALRGELDQLRMEQATQHAREESAAEVADRFDQLAAQGFVSGVTARQRRDELLDHTARRHALERSRLALERDVAALAGELDQLPLRADQQRAEVERELATLEQDAVGAAAARTVLVTAPEPGVVTAIAAERGQPVGPQPLASLLPAGGALEAHLFAPSRAIGFIEPGQKVRVRFAAYPYQKFGQYEGEIAFVSRVALAPTELPPPLAGALAPEAVYRITVRLAAAEVMAYGRAQPLTAGMQLEADVLQDRRRLIEWVFEPLIALGKKV
jgi:membrane fusion protein